MIIQSRSYVRSCQEFRGHRVSWRASHVCVDFSLRLRAIGQLPVVEIPRQLLILIGVLRACDQMVQLIAAILLRLLGDCLAGSDNRTYSKNYRISNQSERVSSQGESSFTFAVWNRKREEGISDLGFL